MRLIIGILIGFAAIIGGAYIHDQSLPETGGKRIVNWDVAGELARRGVERAREEFDKLVAK
ncbi:MAG: hypothetical protein ACXWKA_16550 [Xanthobacteraceae bacterium]